MLKPAEDRCGVRNPKKVQILVAICNACSTMIRFTGQSNITAARKTTQAAAIQLVLTRAEWSCETLTGIELVYTKSISKEVVMQQAKLFQNGQSQAVRLPKNFRFEGDRVAIKRVGKAVILLPYNEPWDTLFDALSQFSPDFMDERTQPPADVREEF